MNNTEWLFFSFTLSARNQAGRMRVWRRLGGLGAVIVRGALYALPRREALREQLAWLAREVEGLGGEALFLESGPPANLDGEALARLFTQAREEDWQALENDILPLLDQARARAADPSAVQALRKLARRAEALEAIDYFPGPRGARAAALLEELKALHAPGGEGPVHGIAPLRPGDYQGLEWITRERPYIDRLASIWLVRRFIDPGARLAFVPEAAPCPPRPGAVRFDMDQAEFTHTGPLTTFETLCAAFGLEARIPARLRETIRAIDLDGPDSGPPEAVGVKRLLDGLCRVSDNDLERVRRALDLFDALQASHDNPASKH